MDVVDKTQEQLEFEEILRAEEERQKQDLHLKLLLGLDFTCLDKIVFHQNTLLDIAKIGFSNYNKFLNIFNVHQDVLDKLSTDDIKLTDFYYLMYHGLHETELKQHIKDAFYFFFKTDVEFANTGFYFEKYDLVVDEDMFKELKSIIHQSQCITLKEEEPVDEKVSEYLKKIEELKRQMSIKKSHNSGIDILDIISSVSCRSNNLSYEQIKKLTVYQLFDCFKRLGKIDDFFIKVNAMMHGATQEENSLKHYSEKSD